MTTEQLEANWGWDDKRGSIPFKRPRLTPKNISDQRELARAGTLTHWSTVPCSRGLRMVDTVPVIGAQPPKDFMKQADHIENVNCLQCRRLFLQTQAARKKVKR